MPLLTDADTITAVIDTVTTAIDTTTLAATTTGDPFHIVWPTVIDSATKLIIAGAAVVTAFYARRGITSWMDQKTKSEGHDLAVEILSEMYELHSYMDGGLNYAITWAQHAKIINDDIIGSDPKIVLPWDRPIVCAEWVTERSNKINRLVCKSKAIGIYGDTKPDLGELLSQTTMSFSGYMFELHGRIKAQYEQDRKSETESNIDVPAIQEGIKAVYISMEFLMSQFKSSYHPTLIKNEPSKK